MYLLIGVKLATAIFVLASITALLMAIVTGFPKKLPKIGEVRVWCSCGWSGRVYDCEPDVDGDGSLGCPVCLLVVHQSRM